MAIRRLQLLLSVVPVGFGEVRGWQDWSVTLVLLAFPLLMPLLMLLLLLRGAPIAGDGRPGA